MEIVIIANYRELNSSSLRNAFGGERVWCFRIFYSFWVQMIG